MSFYLLGYDPGTAQYVFPRRGGATLSGTCIIHTAECARDDVGEDTSAEGTAKFIAERADYGSYHTLVDSDSIIEMVPYEYETWQDTETNNWAVGISAALRTTDWGNMPKDREERVYRNLAWAAADFVKYMRTKGIEVPRKRITGAQARARVPGFCAHGDSGVSRSDPGINFDWARFFRYTDEALLQDQLTTIKEALVSAKELFEHKIERNGKTGKGEGKSATLADVVKNYNQINVRLFDAFEALSKQLTQVEKNLTQHHGTTHGKVNALAELVGKLGDKAGLTPEETKVLLTDALRESITSVNTVTTTELKLARPAEEVAQ